MPPVTLNESPLLILLGIVDTIDPVKIYSDGNNSINANDILDSFLITCDNNIITLKKRKKSKLDFEKIINRSNDLLGWLDVEINHKKDELFIIIKHQ